MRTICRRPSLYFGLAMVVLLSLACGVLPTSNPEIKVKAAFEKWASQAGVPYKDVSYQTIKNDGTFATVRVQATLKQSATEDWLTKQADIECRHVGSEWQCGSAFVFSLTEAERARQTRIASGTATAAAIKLQATATEQSKQAEATRQVLIATQEVLKQNANATATAVALGATATALAPHPTSSFTSTSIVKVTVLANKAAGVSSGLMVRQGDVLTFSASGNWCWGVPLDCSSPNGTPERPGPQEGVALLPGEPFGKLVGRVGDWMFPIGSYAEVVMAANGDLVLFMNERGASYYYDNSGSVAVEIKVKNQ